MDIVILLIFEMKLGPTLVSILLTYFLAVVISVVIATTVTRATPVLDLMGSMAFFTMSSSSIFSLKWILFANFYIVIINYVVVHTSMELNHILFDSNP